MEKWRSATVGRSVDSDAEYCKRQQEYIPYQLEWSHAPGADVVQAIIEKTKWCPGGALHQPEGQIEDFHNIFADIEQLTAGILHPLYDIGRCGIGSLQSQWRKYDHTDRFSVEFDRSAAQYPGNTEYEDNAPWRRIFQ